ncbi:hypothetical protein EDC94DRAFT_607270 [Helicostylum pulchrum]|nr:hypothetical protein EDC94DRAFT_607270 [Helicostylum pulchrum]
MPQNKFYKYDDSSSVSKMPLVQSRFEEHTMYPISIQDSISESNSTTKPTRIRKWCGILASLSLVFGISLMVCSIIFKFQMKGHITEAMEQDCPYSCVTACYGGMPFDRDTELCDSDFRSSCMLQCESVGMKKARMYSILFLAFVSAGGLLVVVQVIHGFVGYCCYSHTLYKKEKINQVIPL